MLLENLDIYIWWVWEELEYSVFQIYASQVGWVWPQTSSNLLENYERSPSYFCMFIKMVSNFMKFIIFLGLNFVWSCVCLLNRERSWKLFYNPAATKLVPNEEFGIAFNGMISDVDFFVLDILMETFQQEEIIYSFKQMMSFLWNSENEITVHITNWLKQYGRTQYIYYPWNAKSPPYWI